MNKVKQVIISNDKKLLLVDKHNKACNTNYQLSDIQRIIEYDCNFRKISLYEIIFKDFIKQRFIKDSLEIDNFI